MARNETVLGLLSTDDAASQQDDPWTSPHDHGLPPLPHLHPDDPIDNQSDLVADFDEGGLEGAPPAQMLEAAAITAVTPSQSATSTPAPAPISLRTESTSPMVATSMSAVLRFCPLRKSASYMATW